MNVKDKYGYRRSDSPDTPDMADGHAYGEDASSRRQGKKDGGSLKVSNAKPG